MTFACNNSLVEGSLFQLHNLSSTRDTATTFTSIIETVKLTSDHWGRPNHEVHVEAVSIRYTPQGTGTFRCSWEFDGGGTNGVTVVQNPFAYDNMSTGAAGTSFTLATDANDSTASDMVRDDDVYIQHIEVDDQGKTFEFRISVSDESRPIFTGIEFEADLARSPAYVQGKF